MLCPPDLRPPDEVIERAVTYLIRNLPRIAVMVNEDLHTFMPASHAVRGLLYAYGLQWGPPEWLLASE